MLGQPGLLGIGQREAADQMEREALILARMSRGVRNYTGRPIAGSRGTGASGQTGSGGSTGAGGGIGGGGGGRGQVNEK